MNFRLESCYSNWFTAECANEESFSTASLCGTHVSYGLSLFDMGLVLAFFYLIALAAAIAVSLFIRSTLAPKVDSSLEHGLDHKTGLSIATIAALAIAWLVPLHGNQDWEGVVTKLAVTLVLPILLGCLLLVISNFLGDKSAYRLGRFASGVLLSVFLIPPAGLAVLLSSDLVTAIYYKAVNYPMYSRLCGDAEVQILEKVESAKSVTLIPDAFVWTNQHRENGVTRTAPTGEMLMYQFPQLDYLERPSLKEISGTAEPLEVLTASGDRLRNMNDGSGKTMQLSYASTDRFGAKYQVRSSTLSIPEGQKHGIGGARIEVVRALDNRLIAFAQYYWDNKAFRSCPKETNGKYFVQWFIADALNLSAEAGQRSVLPR